MRDHAGLVIDLLTFVQRDELLRQLLAATAPVPTLGEHLAVVVASMVMSAPQETSSHCLGNMRDF